MITRNQSTFTGFVFPANEVLASQQSNNANAENLSVTAANVTVKTGAAPSTGYYQVKSGLVLISAAWTAGAAFWLAGHRNGSIHGSGAQNRAWAASTQNVGASYSDTVYLNQGDTFAIYATAERGATALYSVVPDYNYFSITKVIT